MANQSTEIARNVGIQFGNWKLVPMDERIVDALMAEMLTSLWVVRNG